MVECIVGVILGCIVFAYQGVGGKVEQQGAAFADGSVGNLVQTAFPDDVLYDKEGAGPDAAASDDRRSLLWRRGLGEVGIIVNFLNN
jgi:hypothetical protein